MNIFGYAGERSNTTSISQFFRSNLIGFGKAYKGLNDQDILFGHLDESNPLDIDVSNPRGVVQTLHGNAGVYIPRRGIKVCLNVRYQTMIRDMAPTDALYTLWDAFSGSYRLWSFIVGDVKQGDLIPLKYLSNISGADGIIDSLFERRKQYEWSDEVMQRNVDIAIVGHTVASIMTERSDLVEAMDVRNIASIIFDATRHNWERMLFSDICHIAT